MFIAVALALIAVAVLAYLYVRNSRKAAHISEETREKCGHEAKGADNCVTLGTGRAMFDGSANEKNPFDKNDSGFLITDKRTPSGSGHLEIDEFADEFPEEKRCFSAGAWGVGSPASFESETYDIVTSEPHTLSPAQQPGRCEIAEASDSLERSHGAIAPMVMGSTEIYYISDIHICHQFDFRGCSATEAAGLLRPKVEELVASLPYKHRGIILIAGDVADSPSRALLFYSLLVQALQARGMFLWRIAVTLGNHELWNGDPQKLAPPQPLDDLVATYREGLKSLGICLLEDDLLAVDERGRGRVVSGKEILRMSNDRLTSICRQSSALILGGIGFGGLNQEFNSVNGYIYGLWWQDGNRELCPNITREEEVTRSEVFSRIHGKLFDACSGRPVVIISHHPPRDWLGHEPVRDWIYVYGHSHRPEFRIEKGHAVALGDNQVGYAPKPWSFKSFWLPIKRIASGVLHDPFSDWEDGIHTISAKQYDDFNRGRGIKCDSRKRLAEGRLLLLKRDELYMFLLKREKLCILDGGKLRSAKHDPSYYLENMVRYATAVNEAFTPYFQLLQQLSAEVRRIGGDGKVHGSIVDVDFTRHISFDPFEQRLKFYEATMEQGKRERTVYNNQAAFFGLLGLKNGYERLLSEGELPLLNASEGHRALLSSCDATHENALAHAREASYLEVGTEMYQNSDRLKTVQYMADKNVIRIWNEKVLGYDEKKLDGAKKKRGLKAGQAKLPTNKKVKTDKALREHKPKKTLEERALLYAAKVRERSEGTVEVNCASYTGGKEDVAATCLNCGYSWSIRADHLLSRCYCPSCRSGSSASGNPV